MADLEDRVAALEEENKTLKASVADLTDRLTKLEAGGPAKKRRASHVKSTSGGASKARPKTAHPKARPGTAKSHARKGAQKSGKAPRSVVKRNADRAKAKANMADLPDNRKGHYHVGKKKIYFALPADQARDDDSKAPQKEPTTKLELSTVRGYNGGSVGNIRLTNNLFFSKAADSITYNVAAVGVKFDMKENSQTFHTGHNEDILALAVHPTKPIVATGQLDPKGGGTPYIMIWDENTGKKINKITFHEKAIIGLAFAAGGKYLVSIGGDDNHVIGIHDWEKGKKPILSMNGGKDEMFGVFAAPHEEKDKDITFITVGQKHLKVWNTKDLTSKDKGKRKLDGRSPSTYSKTKIVQKAFNAICFVDDGVWYVGCASGHIYKMKGNDLVKTLKTKHKGPVGGLVSLGDGKIASIGADGQIIVFNDDKKESAIAWPSAKKEFVKAADHKDGSIVFGTSKHNIFKVDIADASVTKVVEGHSDEVWAAVPNLAGDKVVTVSMDKTLKIWDSDSLVAAHTINLKGKGRSAVFSPDGKYIAVGQWSGRIDIIDTETNEVVTSKKVAGETVDALSFAKDSSFLAAGSWDQNAYTLSVPDLKVLKTFKGHTSSVLMLNVSEDGKFLMTNSKDYESLFWDVESGKQVLNLADVADVKWFGWNCFLGWPVQGIWKGASDGTDINSVDVSGAALAAGDDFGMVRLYHYPSVAEDSPFTEYAGHSSHVANVRFSQDGSTLYSAGGYDKSVMTWAHA